MTSVEGLDPVFSGGYAFDDHIALGGTVFGKLGSDLNNAVDLEALDVKAVLLKAQHPKGPD